MTTTFLICLIGTAFYFKNPDLLMYGILGYLLGVLTD